VTTITEIYSSRSTNWPYLIGTVLAALLLLGFGFQPDQATMTFVVTALVLVTLTANVMTTSSARVTAGGSGVNVHFGVFGWPRFRYPITRIASATTVEVSKWSLLGPGIVWTPSHGLRLTLRLGPALQIVLVNGRRVTISVDDPARAARIIESAIAAADVG
jgi:hypothetical protein